MTLWDNAYVLAQTKLLAGRNTLSSDASMSDANWYLLITEAEAHWKPKLAAEYPYHMFDAPTLMTSSDSGVTYVFPSETAPLAVEVYASLTGPRLVCGQFGDSSADYCWEGSQIRMTMNTARTFANGPYARWVDSPVTIDASTSPTMKPTYTRRLLAHRACILWASRGGMRDPAPFEKMESDAWTEIQQSLKNSNMFYGDASHSRGRVRGLSYLWARGR